MFSFSEKTFPPSIPKGIRWNRNENRKWGHRRPSVRMKGNQNQNQKLWGEIRETVEIPQKSGNGNGMKKKKLKWHLMLHSRERKKRGKNPRGLSGRSSAIKWPIMTNFEMNAVNAQKAFQSLSTREPLNVIISTRKRWTLESNLNLEPTSTSGLKPPPLTSNYSILSSNLTWNFGIPLIKVQL